MIFPKMTHYMGANVTGDAIGARMEEFAAAGIKFLQLNPKDLQLMKDDAAYRKYCEFVGKEKEVYDRAIDYWNDSKYYLEKEDMRTAFGCIEYSHGLLDALRMIHGII